MRFAAPPTRAPLAQGQTSAVEGRRQPEPPAGGTRPGIVMLDKRKSSQYSKLLFVGVLPWEDIGRLVGVQGRQQGSHGKPKGRGNTDEIQHGDAAVALLNLADMRGGQARHGGERRLEETPLLSILPDGRPKEGEQESLVAWLQGGRVVRGFRSIPSPPRRWKIVHDWRGKGGMGVQPCEQ